MSYPAPILNLNFANAKQLVHPAVAFSRASSGSYFDGNGVIRYAKTSVPRFDHDPLTGICKGLLVEPAVTFFDTYSEQFDNEAWTKIRSSITANAIAAPDGTTTADKLVEDTANNSHYIIKSVTVTAGATYTFSCYFKKGERTTVALAAYNGSAFPAAYFNLASGTKVSVDAALTAYMEDVGSGWYKCSITFTMVSGTTCSFFALLSTGDLEQFYTGDGTSGLYIWGAKLYAGTGQTSYLPTTTAGVTRAADLCSVDLTKLTRNGSPLWTGTEGTVVVDALPLIKKQNIILQLGSGQWQNRIYAWFNTNGNLAVNTTIGGVAGCNVLNSFSGDRVRYAFCFSSTGISASVNGGNAVSALGSNFSASTKLYTSMDDYTSFPNTIKSVQLYNRRIADAYLPALSAL